MADAERSLGNFQTLWTELSALSFEAIERAGGYATVIRFRLHNRSVRRGDVLVVLEDSVIRFHGMITSIEEGGWAVASDRRSSTIPAGVH